MTIKILHSGVSSPSRTKKGQYIPDTEVSSRSYFSVKVKQHNVMTKPSLYQRHHNKSEYGVSNASGERKQHHHGQQVAWRPYKPLGDMSSLLHLKVFWIKENQYGEKRLKHIGVVHRDGHDDSEDEVEVQEILEAEERKVNSKKRLVRVRWA